MPRVVFTSNLKRHVECPETVIGGETVRQSLDAVFVEHPQLRGYVLDDQDRLRKHMVVFVDGKAINDRETLGDLVEPSSEIYVMQALSGG
ncbi:MAG: MoaD/ThiS family protein [Planctomycetes bacterium]|nr:MoaD/ThiS family protein [Planctomycetota bacterium]